MTDFRGVYAIMCTPMLPDEELDEAGLRSLVEFNLKAGVHGLTILGIFGEVYRLTDAERDQVTEIVIDQVAGRVPVLVGTGHNSAKVAADYTRKAKAAGAAGVMVAPSAYAKTGQAVKEYYKRVADATDLPIVVQDEPATIGVQMPAALLAELGDVAENIRYVKLEEPPTPPKITQIRALTDKLAIFGGLGGVFYLEEMERGAIGTMTGFAFPEFLVRIYDLIQRDQWDVARTFFYEHLAVYRYENQPTISLALRKEIFRLRGAIAHSTKRQPVRELDTATYEELTSLLRHFQLLK